MALDPYQPCSCGSGKKVRFCCSKDLSAELERIERMIGGDQRMAALDLVNTQLDKTPDRPCLLAYKTMLCTELGQNAQAEEAIVKFLMVAPDNPVALADSALLEASKAGTAMVALPALQKALENCKEEMPQRVYEAIGAFGQALLAEGEILPARGYLLLHASISGEEDNQSLGLLMRLYRSDQIPILLKQEVTFEDPAKDVPWRKDFEQAMRLSNRGAWAPAVEIFRGLLKQDPENFALRKNMAVLTGFLGDHAAVAEAYREIVKLGDAVPLEDRVEAEALAELMFPSEANEVDVKLYKYAVPDADKLSEKLLSSDSVLSPMLDLSQLAEEGQPPPRGAFLMLDKAPPAEGTDLTLENTPNQLAEVLLFGKETDCEARIELAVTAADNEQQVIDTILAACGDLINSEPEIKVVGQKSEQAGVLSVSPYVPPTATPEQRGAFASLLRRHKTLEVWPTISAPSLDGKSPEEAAGHAKYEVRTLALVLLLELAGQTNVGDFDFDELRTKLGLPTLGTIDPTDQDLSDMPTNRLSRLDPAKLTDPQVKDACRRASMFGIPAALLKLGAEVLSRDLTSGAEEKASILGAMARCAAESNEAIRLIHEACSVATEGGLSPANWLLEELHLRIQRRDQAEVQQLVTLLQQQYLNEPGIAQGLYEILAGAGLISPDGPAPVTGPHMAAQGLQQQAAAKQQADGGLWTPDGAQPAAESDEGEGKSKLWVPGMD